MLFRCDTRFEKGENQKAGLNASKDILARDLPSELLKLIYYVDSAILCVIPPIYLD